MYNLHPLDPFTSLQQFCNMGGTESSMNRDARRGSEKRDRERDERRQKEAWRQEYERDERHQKETWRQECERRIAEEETKTRKAKEAEESYRRRAEKAEAKLRELDRANRHDGRARESELPSRAKERIDRKSELELETEDSTSSMDSCKIFSAAIVPAMSSVPLPAAAAVAETSAKTEDPVAPSEVSDSDTDVAENPRKPSDATPSVMTGADEESVDMARQETTVSQVTPSVVTDVPRGEDEQQQQEHTPTAQYLNSPGGYYTHNNRIPGAISPGYPQGHPQGPAQGPVQQQQDTRRSFTGPAYGPGMGQAPPAAIHARRLRPARSAIGAVYRVVQPMEGPQDQDGRHQPVVP
ncbi:hypothetical protein NLG97_g8793 [Lecanicillium saksenae]|uniref:Uncharacterized protein n=1 Tax=Lecanicillium saksenae TaxID=468837 RepID=A0ACC1QJU6_9HYPO|nr:hypothetical protein NLG97_g8793 [Lecanicillium saksenae]